MHIILNTLTAVIFSQLFIIFCPTEEINWYIIIFIKALATNIIYLQLEQKKFLNNLILTPYFYKIIIGYLTIDIIILTSISCFYQTTWNALIIAICINYISNIISLYMPGKEQYQITLIPLTIPLLKLSLKKSIIYMILWTISTPLLYIIPYIC